MYTIRTEKKRDNVIHMSEMKVGNLARMTVGPHAGTLVLRIHGDRWVALADPQLVWSEPGCNARDQPVRPLPDGEEVILAVHNNGGI